MTGGCSVSHLLQYPPKQHSTHSFFFDGINILPHDWQKCEQWEHCLYGFISLTLTAWRGLGVESLKILLSLVSNGQFWPTWGGLLLGLGNCWTTGKSCEWLLFRWNCAPHLLKSSVRINLVLNSGSINDIWDWLEVTKAGRNRKYWMPCGEASNQLVRFKGMGYHTTVSGKQTTAKYPHNSLFHSTGHVSRYYQFNLLWRTALALSNYLLLLFNRNIRQACLKMVY